MYEVNFTKGSAFFRRDRLRQFEGAGPDKSVGDIILNFFPSSRRILMVNFICILLFDRISIAYRRIHTHHMYITNRCCYKTGDNTIYIYFLG
jgi:hypothetical protein